MRKRTKILLSTLTVGGAPDQTWNGHNVLQGASTRVDYRWTLTQTTAAACSDQIRGNQRPNRLIGTSAGDRILGLGGADRIEAMARDDCARGGNGADRVLGGPGSDRLSGGRGPDLLKGGWGDDVIFARGGGVDRVQCGPGRDRAVVDRWDHVRGCEAVRRPGRWIP